VPLRAYGAIRGGAAARQASRNANAETAKAAITPKRMPITGMAVAHPTARIAANSRKRGGASRLPMERRC